MLICETNERGKRIEEELYEFLASLDEEDHELYSLLIYAAIAGKYNDETEEELIRTVLQTCEADPRLDYREVLKRELRKMTHPTKERYGFWGGFE